MSRTAPGTTGRAALIGGLVGIVLGAVYLIQALQYPLGSLATPGPGAFPLVVGALMVVGGLGTAVGALRTREAKLIPWARGPALRRVLVLGLAAVAFVVFFRTVGYPVLAALLAFTAMQICSYRTLLIRVLASVAISAVTYLLFAQLLEMRLPLGVLG